MALPPVPVTDIERLQGRGVQAIQKDPLAEMLGRPAGSDAVRLYVLSEPSNESISLCMQHLTLSAPPYAYAESPGRHMFMTREAFSHWVNELVEMRDRLRIGQMK